LRVGFHDLARDPAGDTGDDDVGDPAHTGLAVQIEREKSVADMVFIRTSSRLSAAAVISGFPRFISCA
jgi:hypothetical protein